MTVETIFEWMTAALCAGENIEIRGLGAFHVKHYEGYQGRNPKTGEVIPVRPKRGILFRTGKELRDRVNHAEEEEAAAAAGRGGGHHARAGRDQQRRAVARVRSENAAPPAGQTGESGGSSS